MVMPSRAFALLAAASLIATVAGVASVACGDSVRIVECPLGTLPEGDRCVPIAPEDATEADTSPSDTAVAPEVTDTATAAGDGQEEVAPDAGPEDVAAPGTVGAACDRGVDCAGGTCLDWPGGYCTLLGCASGGCPEGSACVDFAGNAICVRDCAEDGDCGSAAQACKALPAEGGAVHRACVGVRPSAGATGASCADATGCLGAAICLTAFPGGYCAALDCAVKGCPPEGRCVRVDGRPTCLLGCTDDASCGGVPGAERRCGALAAVPGGDPVQVCISGVAERELGELCRSDFECATGTCQILGEGRCSQSGGPCFPASVDMDCTGAEFCHVTGDSRVGVCARPCSLGGVACPGASFCLAEDDDPARGYCRPLCSPGGGECNAEASLVCRFGIPITDGGQGRYVCSRDRPRRLGALCQSGAACASGHCLLPAAGPGYCTMPCLDDGFCSFPGLCVYGAEERCHLACFSAEDCPVSFACELATGSSRPVCVPSP